MDTTLLIFAQVRNILAEWKERCVHDRTYPQPSSVGCLTWKAGDTLNPRLGLAVEEGGTCSGFTFFSFRSTGPTLCSSGRGLAVNCRPWNEGFLWLRVLKQLRTVEFVLLEPRRDVPPWYEQYGKFPCFTDYLYLGLVNLRGLDTVTVTYELQPETSARYGHNIHFE